MRRIPQERRIRVDPTAGRSKRADEIFRAIRLRKTEGRAIRFPPADRICAFHWGQREDKRRGNAFATFGTKTWTGLDFFYFFARNPLKSPDSDE
jgi:hypothetical protein